MMMISGRTDNVPPSIIIFIFMRFLGQIDQVIRLASPSKNPGFATVYSFFKINCKRLFALSISERENESLFLLLINVNIKIDSM